MEAITAKVSSLSLKMLKDMAIQLSNDFQDGADVVLDAVMARLEALMPETQFVAFCDTL